MSNPGVINLASKSNIGLNLKRIDIEDNIGECIHLHINNIRFNFTINEFLNFSRTIESSFINLTKDEKLDLSSYDKQFLFHLSPYISKISKIESEKIKISELRCILHKRLFRIPYDKYTNLEESPQWAYCKGDKSSLEEYEQQNYISCSNLNRFERLLKLLDTNKSIDPLVLFEGDNFIRDGLHRAVAYKYLKGDSYIADCHRLYFKDNILKLKTGKAYSAYIFSKNLIILAIKFFKRRIKDFISLLKK